MAERPRDGVRVRLLPPGRHVRPGAGQAVSYLDDGVQVLCAFDGGGRWVCDAERIDREPREAVVRSHGLPRSPLGFAVAWTRAEVSAKAVDVPVVQWLREESPPVPPGPVRSVVVPGWRVALSWARART